MSPNSLNLFMTLCTVDNGIFRVFPISCWGLSFRNCSIICRFLQNLRSSLPLRDSASLRCSFYCITLLTRWISFTKGLICFLCSHVSKISAYDACSALHSVFIFISRDVPAFLELGLEKERIQKYIFKIQLVIKEPYCSYSHVHSLISGLHLVMLMCSIKHFFSLLTLLQHLCRPLF